MKLLEVVSMGKQAGNNSESKIVGTISNKMMKMSKKERLANRVKRLSNLSQGEIDIMKKYGTYDEVMSGIVLNSQLSKN